METVISKDISGAREVVDIESQHASKPVAEPVISSLAETSGSLNLARIMASNDSLAIFRRFDDLSMLNLLCLQTELTSLQAELLDLVTPQDKSNLSIERNLFKNPKHIDFSPFVGNESSLEQELLEKIRVKLKEYS
jgi:hypothetical protein